MKILKIKYKTILILTSISILVSSCSKDWLKNVVNRHLQTTATYIVEPCNNFAPHYNISVEFCDNDYLIDTKGRDNKLSEHPSAALSRKIIFIHFTIENYKREFYSSYASKYVIHELYIIDDSKSVNPIVKIINIDKDNPEILWMDPQEISQNYASLTTGTIRTSISWNAQLNYELEEMGEKKYKFYIKTTYPRISQTSYYDDKNPIPCNLHPFCNASGENAIVTEVYSQNIKLKNYQLGTDGQNKREKIMNLYIFGNTSECDMTNYKWISTTKINSFAETFTTVWAGEGFSDIHVLPNFMPNANSSPNYKNAINNAIPEFLVSNDGYIVLSPDDFANSNVREKNSAEDKVKAAIQLWNYRFFDFLTWKHKNPYTSYNGITSFDMYPSDCKLNIGALVTVKGCKIYNWDKYTAIPTLKATQFVYENSIQDSIDIGQINNNFNWFGVTSLDACSGYLGLSLIFRNTHLKYPSIVSDGFCIATAMHELAHLWNFNGTTDSTFPTEEDSHHAYVKGFDSDYCLMRISPSYGSNYEDFYKKQIENMKFSDGLEQRITNTMIYKK